MAFFCCALHYLVPCAIYVQHNMRISGLYLQLYGASAMGIDILSRKSLLPVEIWQWLVVWTKRKINNITSVLSEQNGLTSAPHFCDNNMSRMKPCAFWNTMTSSNGNVFRATGLLWRECTGRLTKASDTELWFFFAPEQTVEQTIERRRWFETHRSHNDVTVMVRYFRGVTVCHLWSATLDRPTTGVGLKSEFPLSTILPFCFRITDIMVAYGISRSSPQLTCADTS